MRIGLLFGLLAASAGARAEPSATNRAEGEKGVAVILNEPGLAVKGAASSPEMVARIIGDAGVVVRPVSAEQLADTAVLDAKAVDILVLPYGESFPSVARSSVVGFLHGGGDLITMGGYAFNHLLRKEEGRWMDEVELLKARRERATGKQSSLTVNGDFESSQELASGGATAAGQWQRTSDQCMIVAEGAQEGRFCGKVAAGADSPDKMPTFRQDIPAKAGATYQVSGWLRGERVSETGMAYIALYQYGPDNKFVRHNDFAVARGTTGWQQHRLVFTPGPGVVRLHIQFGLYQAFGTAWFDDIRLSDVTGTEVLPMNTATGKPADGLEISPEQIGMFDASFPLERARLIRVASGQHVVKGPIDLRGELRGWAASGVVGNDDARWIPLLQTYDRYDRPRGAAGAMLLHYGGYYAGSCWAYFGVDNMDLFGDPAGPAAEGLRNVTGFLLRKTFLHNLRTDHRLYRAGEAVKASVIVDNQGRRMQSVRVKFSLGPEGADRKPSAAVVKEAVVQPRSAQPVEATFPGVNPAEDLCRVTATLLVGEEPIDEMTSGLVVERPEVVKGGAELRFRDNYFTVNGRPTFLFGSDTYAYTYKSAHENPLTWSQDHRAARDVGLNLYENLQYVNPGHRMTDEDWRDFRAMGQLTQKYNLVFMPGMLIGHNVAVGDVRLAEEAELCRGYAGRLGDLPGLLYYINGDYQMRLDEHPQDVKGLWNRWLTDRYGTTEKLRAVWGSAVTGELGSLDFWPPDSGRWDDVAVVDRLRFQNWLTRRWNETHVAAVRKDDVRHPITSEYYQVCWGGLDLMLTIDGQDVANIGYFDRPEDDIENLPMKIRFNDLRARGKGVSLGEYGVKTHPAWTVENGAQQYHIVRTVEQQKQLFLAVAHYALGLGASKIQNWCLQDAQAWVFPWGMFYPNQLIPKGAALAHRNLSMVWRHFSPRYVPPTLTVCVPDNLRLGNQEAIGRTVADRAFGTLLELHYDFNVIDDHHLDKLPPETRVMVYPSAFVVGDDTYGRLLSWVNGGGTLLVTGDISYDENRQRTRTGRLREMAGVEFVAENYANVCRGKGVPAQASFSFEPLRKGVVRACVRVKAVEAEVLGRTADGDPVFTRRRVGQGWVYFFTDPVELGDDREAAGLRRGLYSAFLRATSVRPVGVHPDEPWLHAMVQPTARGAVHVIYNRKENEGREDVTLATAAGPVTLGTRNRWPALAAVTNEGKVVAVNAFSQAGVGEKPIMGGTGLKALLSLDGADLRQSQALLIAPFEPGRLELPSRGGGLVGVAGEFRDGVWRALERINVDPQRVSMDIDPDRAACMILLCGPSAESKWAGYLTAGLQHPERIQGY